MNMYRILIFWIVLSGSSTAYGERFATQLIPPDLLRSANKVIREHQVSVSIERVDLMITEERKTYTIFDNGPSDQVPLGFYHDPNHKIKNLSATIYDANGKTIKKIKKKAFEDISATSGSTLYSDARQLTYIYSATSFPITVSYEITTESSTTAFIDSWSPLPNYQVATEGSTYRIEFKPSLGLKSKEYNFEKYPSLSKIDQEGIIIYSTEQLAAIKYEYGAPSWSKIRPSVSFALEHFSLEGVQGKNQNWNILGEWMYHRLVKGRGYISTTIKKEINDLIKDLSDDEEKARAIYRYVQQRSRYISVQLGIGGWQPIAAQKVHDDGYGDCKGLTNYTMALLTHAGIPAYYSVLYGGKRRDLDPTYSKISGNHAILCLPNLPKGDTTWLECTSSTDPFGYLGSFTDNRTAMLITPTGGNITRTSSFGHQVNLHASDNHITIAADGSANFTYESSRYGQQYDYRHRLSKYDKDPGMLYRQYWPHLSGLKIKKTDYNLDKVAVRVYESVDGDIPQVGHMTSDGTMIIETQLLRHPLDQPPRVRGRTLPFIISQGYTQQDKTIIEIPTGYRHNKVPEAIDIESPFGIYKLTIRNTDSTQVEVTRNLIIKEGQYPPEEYKQYRSFLKKIKKSDQQKIVITNKT